MKEILLEPPKDVLRVGPARRLQTVNELVDWEIWKNAHDGHPLSDDHKSRKFKYYENILDTNGLVGTGDSYLDPAVFAVFDQNQIIAAGSVRAQSCHYPYYHLSAKSRYAFITDAFTQAEYRGHGLNTQITQARVGWASQSNLPLVVTRVKLSKPASIQAKLKAGFRIDAVSDSYLTLLYPLKEAVNRSSGLHEITPYDKGEDMPLHTINTDRFEGEYGALSEFTNWNNGLYVRMIPREFGAREI